MVKISKKEYEILKSLDDRWKWIARDGSGELYIYGEKPKKFATDWVSERDYYLYLGNKAFQFIQWEDEEPCGIAELIEEYEIEQHIKESVELGEQAMRDHARKKVRKESEGTEMKSKQELIEKWESAIESAEFYGKGKEEELIGYMKDFVSDLKQLDEPEVLSQEWIVDNVSFIQAGRGYVLGSKLQNLLVPKQEEVDDYTKGWTDGIAAYVEDLHSGENLVVIEKPTIPPEVDELIRRGKGRGETLTNTVGLMKKAGWNRSPYADGAEWAVKNLSDFVIAWEHGYEAEEPRQEEHDPVHRPQHYMQGHIETIDKIKLLLTPEEYLGYLKGNVIKYDRAPFKGNMEQDYDKQKVYYDWALAELED